MLKGIDTVIIPAAGHGTRLRPITQHIAKEVLPIALKPMIQYTLEEVEQAGIERALVVINDKKEILERWLRAYQKDTPVNLEIVYQNEKRGVGDAILRCFHKLDEEDVYLALPDNIIYDPGELVNPFKLLYKAYTDTHQSVTGLMTIDTPREASCFGNAGRVDLQPHAEHKNIYHISKLHAKREGVFEAEEGREVSRTVPRALITAEALKLLQEMWKSWQGPEEFDDVPWYQKLVAQKQLMGIYLDGDVYDVGNRPGFLRADLTLTKHILNKQLSTA